MGEHGLVSLLLLLCCCLLLAGCLHLFHDHSVEDLLVLRKVICVHGGQTREIGSFTVHRPIPLAGFLQAIEFLLNCWSFDSLVAAKRRRLEKNLRDGLELGAHIAVLAFVDLVHQHRFLLRRPRQLFGPFCRLLGRFDRLLWHSSIWLIHGNRPS